MRQDRVTPAIRRLIRAHGRASAGSLAAALGISRQAGHRHLVALVEQGLLERAGKGRASHYLPRSPAAQRWSYRARGLEEDRVWQELLAGSPVLAALPPNARDILAYAVTEMVNNAIDHARSRRVEIAVHAPSPLVRIEILDDGIGIFRHLAASLALEQEILAIEQLSKGKLTTDPERHTGEGIFFTSKAVDVFELHGSRLCWLVDNRIQDYSIRDSEQDKGTQVALVLDPSTDRQLRTIFEAYTESSAFVRTRVVVRLFERGTTFVSRSEARRLLRGLEEFKEVVLDFAGVRGIGQGFADEVLRVWPRLHAGVRLVPVNMAPEVEFMVRRALAVTVGR